jgi:GAF domain-containing protein
VECDAVSRRRFAFLADVSPLLAIAQDVDTTLMHVAQLAVPAIADGFVVDLLEPQAETIRQLIVVHQPGTDRRPLTFQRNYTPSARGQRRSKRAASEQGQIATGLPEPLLADLAPDAELRAVLNALAPTAAIVMPLQAREERLGSLSLLLADTQRQYGPGDLALAEELARRIAIAVDRTQAFRSPLG